MADQIAAMVASAIGGDTSAASPPAPDASSVFYPPFTSFVLLCPYRLTITYALALTQTPTLILNQES